MISVLIYFPLYYNSKSIFRLYGYLKETEKYSNTFKLSVFISNSNSEIRQEAKSIANYCGFLYENRDNYGRGEGGLLNFIINNKELIDMFDFLIYFEESCEPVSKKWLYKLIQNCVQMNLNVNGWDWWWRPKKRELSRTQVIGSGFRIGILNENQKLSINNDDLNFTNYDVFGFRHELLVVRTSELAKLIFNKDDIHRNLQIFSDMSFGRIVERIYWESNNQNLKNLNIQYPLLRSQKKLPLIFNTNLTLFRELKMEEKKSDNYIPKSLIWRKYNYSYLMYIVKRLSYDFLQYLFVKLGFEIKSITRKRNETISY